MSRPVGGGHKACGDGKLAYEPVRFREDFQPPLSDVALSNELRSYIWDKSSDGLFPRYVPSADTLENAAVLLEQLHECLNEILGSPLSGESNENCLNTARVELHPVTWGAVRRARATLATAEGR